MRCDTEISTQVPRIRRLPTPLAALLVGRWPREPNPGLESVHYGLVWDRENPEKGWHVRCTAEGMKRVLAALALVLPGFAGAQGLLEFRSDLAFSATEVDALAAKQYEERLRALARAGQLDR